MNEFSLIQRYFASHAQQRGDVIKGIGDDSALVTLPPHHELVVTTDTLIAGVHFPAATLPEDIGYKALAVNLSDLAAMGAVPAWATLALTLPEAKQDWLDAFCRGFFSLADMHQVQLIGGDTTRGALTVTVQALGLIPSHQAMLRSRALPADLIYVTGSLGDAALALRSLKQAAPLQGPHASFLFNRLNRPEPRIACGMALRHIAHAAIDISDGLAADLNHVLEASETGAVLYVDQLPFSAAVRDTLSLEESIHLALTGGDDYELCFTVPPENEAALEKKLSAISCCYTRIGRMTAERGLHLRYSNGNAYHGPLQGYQHF